MYWLKKDFPLADKLTKKQKNYVLDLISKEIYN